MTRVEAGKLGFQAGLAGMRAAQDRRAACYLAKGIKCPHCGCAMPYEKRGNEFCSRGCWAKSKVKPERHAGRPVGGHCACGKPISRAASACQACFGRSMRKPLGAALSPGTIRARLLEQRGNQCEICGLAEWQGKLMPLDVDHVSGDSSDNSPGNLRLLCPNCHAQTDTYKAKNRGNGRAARRKALDG